MKELPKNLNSYKKTAIFNQETVPAGAGAGFELTTLGL